MSSATHCREPKSRYSAIIFDLDGTLIDTPRAIADTMLAVIRQGGYPTPDVDTVIPLVGSSLEDTFRFLLPRNAWSFTPDYVQKYRELYARTVIPNTVLFPGVMEVLTYCKRKAIYLTVATSKVTYLAEATLGHCDIRQFFDVVIGGDMVSRLKPDPESAARILQEIGCTPDETLVIGDTVSDIEMGQAIGTVTCAVAFGAQPRDQLLQVFPDYCIDQFCELVPILDGVRLEDDRSWRLR